MASRGKKDWGDWLRLAFEELLQKKESQLVLLLQCGFWGEIITSKGSNGLGSEHLGKTYSRGRKKEPLVVCRGLVLAFECPALGTQICWGSGSVFSDAFIFFPLRSACMKQLIKFSPGLGFGMERYVWTTSIAWDGIHIWQQRKTEVKE